MTKVTTWPSKEDLKKFPKLRQEFVKSWGKKLAVFVSGKNNSNGSVSNGHPSDDSVK